MTRLTLRFAILCAALALAGVLLNSRLRADVIYGSPQLVITAYKYTHITTDATTTLKSGGGILHTICINNPTATATVTIYDNTAGSGTVIGVITEAATTQGCFTYDVNFTTGLTIVTAVAVSDITGATF